MLSPVTSKTERDHANVERTVTRTVSNTADKSVKRGRHRIPQWAELLRKTTQRHFHRETSEAGEATATGVTPSELEAATAQTVLPSTLETRPTEKNGQTQLQRGAGRGISEAQNASRSTRAQAKEETAGPEYGSRLLLSEPKSESELPRLNLRRASPHPHLSGLTKFSDDLCGSGNYTAEMSLNLGRAIQPGDAVPALGSPTVVINLNTNNSRINFGVTSCCLSPTIQPNVTNSTCYLFSRLAAQHPGVTLLPSALSTSASFTISLFQLINYSAVYLHCDLSVCLRNNSDCERRCLQQRSAFPSEGPDTIVTNLRNRISFGPLLKQEQNSTFPEEIDQSELDLVLVIVSLVVGLSLVTVMLLLVWLAYRHRVIRLPPSTAPPRACCACLHPGGDLILP
ncbi:unnamed protein product [Menidia menidia]|uniref:(Atlantic silverside) hypothetical protein n=1 Tax=Menidia menidia TaxID=238744 RepID=A0A8S4BPH1_9TELE|nr:unnamed protein product [Menidia menidia]